MFFFEIEILKSRFFENVSKIINMGFQDFKISKIRNSENNFFENRPCKILNKLICGGPAQRCARVSNVAW